MVRFSPPLLFQSTQDPDTYFVLTFQRRELRPSRTIDFTRKNQPTCWWPASGVPPLQVRSSPLPPLRSMGHYAVNFVGIFNLAACLRSAVLTRSLPSLHRSSSFPCRPIFYPFPVSRPTFVAP